MSVSESPNFLIPTQIGGCQMWFDAADASSTILSGGRLIQWNDKSGNRQNMTVVGTQSNTIISSNAQNNLNVLNLTGLNLYRTPINSGFYPSDCYIVLASKALARTDFLGMGNTSSDNFNSLTLGEHTALRWHNGSSGFLRTPLTVSPTNETSTGFLLMNWSLANNNYVLRRNTLTISETTAYTYTIGGNPVFQIGFRHTDGNVSNLNCDAFIAEIIVFNTQLSQTQRNQIEGYLAWKWGLQASLPGGHPFVSQRPQRNEISIPITFTPYFRNFTPLQIPNCFLWLDAADPSCLTLVGSAVSQWRDKSPSGTIFSQANSSSRPTYGTSKINGLDVISSTSSQVLTSTNFNQTATPYTVFYVIRPTETTMGAWDFYSVLMATAQSGAIYFYIELWGDLSRFQATFGSRFLSGIGGNLGASSRAGIVHLISSYFTGNTGTNAVNLFGSALTLNNATFAINAFQNLSMNTAGGGKACDYGEILLFNRILSTNELQQVESYLSQKWGLTTTLPVGHVNTTRPAGTPLTLATPSVPRFLTQPFPSILFTFAYTGANQTMTVPAGITRLAVYLWGAGGGAGLGGNGGAGCYVQGVLTVTPGETLTILVGQGGANKSRGFGRPFGGGGEGGGGDNGRSDIPPSQGGGRSAILRAGVDIVTAGAGGGSRGQNGARGGLITGATAAGSGGTGGTQSAGGSANGAQYSGGNANQDNSAGGGSGFFGGGGAGQDRAGGGGSSLTANLALIPGQTTFGTESSNGVLAPQTTSPFYRTDVAFGATSAYGYNYGNGGNGLVVLAFESAVSMQGIAPSGLIIIEAWYSSVAYRFGISVTTIVRNAFNGNRNNTIVLDSTTFTNPQVGTAKFTRIVYSFNGVQKFSAPYAEGTTLTFSSLT